MGIDTFDKLYEENFFQNLMLMTFFLRRMVNVIENQFVLSKFLLFHSIESLFDLTSNIDLLIFNNLEVF